MYKLAAAALLASTAAANAVSLSGPFTSFWTLGDSLSDTGNIFAASGGTVPAAPVYFDGRFSNGPVWAETVAATFTADGKPTGNFAFGGATAVPDADTVPDLPTQIAFLSAEVAAFGDRPLVALWFGGNDILRGADPVAAATAASAAIADGARALGGLGVEDFLILNFPATSLATNAFNTGIAAEIATLEGEGLNVIDVDLTALIPSIIADPSSKITDFATPCVLNSSSDIVSVCTPDEAEQRFFFDAVHPNAEVHARVGALASAQVAAVPLPSSIAGLLLGVAALGVVRRRKI